MTQPEALRLAGELECGFPVTGSAAAELRRLHAELERCKQVCAATAESWRESDEKHREAQAAIYRALGTENPDRDAWPEEIRALKLDAERYRYLRNRNPQEILPVIGPAAGAWIDCDDEDGELVLLTGEDADAVIDAERGKE